GRWEGRRPAFSRVRSHVPPRRYGESHEGDGAGAGASARIPRARLQCLRDGRGPILSKRALITGGTGFVGANLVRRLLSDGHEVHLLVRGSHNPWRLEDVLGQVRLHEADLGDAPALGRSLADVRPDWIFHL